MDAQSAELELDHYHDLMHGGDYNNKVLGVYEDLVIEEFGEFQEAGTLGNKIKEAVDVIVVTRPLIRFGSELSVWGNYAVSQAVKGFLRARDVNWCVALHKVNESNLSKFILENEIDEAVAHFSSLNISVDIKDIGDGYFCAFSSRTQEVDGKRYKGGKGLKGPNYHAIDESTEWWK